MNNFIAELHLPKSAVITTFIFIGLSITLWIYYPGLYGGFEFDDEANILKNERLHLTQITPKQLANAALSGMAGPLKRPVSMLSFALNLYVSGENPFYFKLTNLAIHLLSGIGLFFLTLGILTACKKTIQPDFNANYIYLLSGLITLSWLVHPINLTSVLYIVQRMNSLAAFFTIGALNLFVWGRIRLMENRTGLIAMLFGIVVFGVLASLSKENGLLLPLYMLAIEITLFRFRTATFKTSRILKYLFCMTVALPVVIVLGYTLLSPDWIIRSYQIREFSLSERLFTEARVIWYYLKLIFFPENTSLSVFHDDFIISHGLLDPVSTLFSVTGLVLLLAGIIVALKKAPILALGLLIFLFGHVMESTILALELVHEHRNYFPSYGILFALFYYLIYPLKTINLFRIRFISSCLIISLFGFVTAIRAETWGNIGTLALAEARHHPDSSRANYELGYIYLILSKKNGENTDQYYTKAQKQFEKATVLKSSLTAGLFAMIQMANETGREIKTPWVEELVRRLKNQPLSASTINALDVMASCKKQNRCLPQQGIVESFINAALQNPRVLGLHKATLYTNSAKYYLQTLNKPEYALGLMRMAAKTLPNNPRFQMDLVTLLSIMDRPEETHEELQRLKKLDTFGAYKREAEQIERLLLL